MIVSKKYLGFIGVGHMGSAMIQGFLAADYPEDHLCCYDHQPISLPGAGRLLHAQHEKDVVQRSDYVFLAVKPKDLQSVLEKIGPFRVSNEPAF